MKDFILKRMASIILPFICIYGFYVILHGHVSPGGSFAGGIIVGLSFIAYSTIYGIEKGRKKLPEKVLVAAESYGTLWYGIMGLVGIIKGVPFLANKLAGVDLGVPGTLNSGGLISFIGFGVGIRVASTMVTLFFTMMEEE
ncbi:MAG TPA: sodium:proton antiporter [Clostridiaceae bacterium]|jgi:multicomponent Na+:H+ antiporter subunit B|nr:sodium:proton antiporter [Clostridiaceae bacterium]